MATKPATSDVQRQSNPGVFRAAFDLVISKHPQLLVQDKAAWTQLQGPTGLKMYVAKQRQVRHVHLSGWGAGLDGTCPPDGPNGRVQAQLDFSRLDGTVAREQELLGAFHLLCTCLEQATVGLPPRRSPTPRLEGQPKPGSRAAKAAAKAAAEAAAKKASSGKRAAKAAAQKAKAAKAEQDRRTAQAAADAAAEQELDMTPPAAPVGGVVIF